VRSTISPEFTVRPPFAAQFTFTPVLSTERDVLMAFTLIVLPESPIPSPAESLD